MKILHISRSMGQGGAQKIVYQLCKDNLQEEQVVLSAGGYFVEDLKRCGIRHYTIPDMESKNPITVIRILLTIWRVVRKENIDILHTHHRMAAFYARIISAVTGLPHMYTAHNVFFDKKKLVRFSLDKAHIVAVGNGVKKNLTSFYSIEEDKITVIRNTIEIKKSGIPNALLDELAKEHKILIGTIGRLSKQKGMDIFLSCIEKITKKYPDAIGIIIGDGEERNPLQQEAKRTGIFEHTIFLGYQKDVLDLISQLDIVVLASRWEGLPLTPIEVFSQGKTIVASNIDGNNEIIQDGFNGYLCKTENVDDFVRKIEELICDISTRKRLERNAQKTFLNEFSYKAFISAYQQIYLKAVNSKR